MLPKIYVHNRGKRLKKPQVDFIYFEKQFFLPLKKFANTGVTKDDIIEMIPKKYVEYIPDEKGELYNGWF